MLNNDLLLEVIYAFNYNSCLSFAAFSSCPRVTVLGGNRTRGRFEIKVGGYCNLFSDASFSNLQLVEAKRKSRC